MVKYLLDTNILSELRKPRPETRVLKWFQEVNADTLFVSVLTIGEIVQGLYKIHSTDPAKSAQLNQWLSLLNQQFKNKIIEIDVTIAETWGRINGEVMQNGPPLNAIDGLLAATSIVHNMTLVTRNVRDFNRATVNLLNPWEI